MVVGLHPSYDRLRVGLLICTECGKMSEDGEGWKGELAVNLLDEKESAEVAVFCPECWADEFSET